MYRTALHLDTPTSWPYGCRTHIFLQTSKLNRPANAAATHRNQLPFNRLAVGDGRGAHATDERVTPPEMKFGLFNIPPYSRDYATGDARQRKSSTGISPSPSGLMGSVGKKCISRSTTHSVVNRAQLPR